jgi:hypothetical protein
VFSAAEDIELVTAERPVLVVEVVVVATGNVVVDVDVDVTGPAIYKPPIKVVENFDANVFWRFFEKHHRS